MGAIVVKKTHSLRFVSDDRADRGATHMEMYRLPATDKHVVEVEWFTTYWRALKFSRAEAEAMRDFLNEILG